MHTLQLQVADLNVVIKVENAEWFTLLRKAMQAFAVDHAQDSFEITINIQPNRKKFEPQCDILQLKASISCPDDISQIPELYFNLKILFSRFAVTRNFLLLHASSFVSEDVCYVSCGPSGAGKSTINQFVVDKKIGLPTNDDSVLIGIRDKKVMAFTNPFVEKSQKLLVPQAHHVGAIFYLHQSSKDETISLSKARALKILMSNSYLFQNDNSDTTALTTYYDLCYTFIRLVPVFELTFTRSATFFSKMRNSLKILS